MTDDNITPSPFDRTARRLVAVQDIWIQCSSDYKAIRHRRTKIFSQDAPLCDVIAWSKRAHCLQAGQVTLTEEDAD